MTQTHCLKICFLLLAMFPLLFGQTTGKIAGVVLDQQTNDPLPGANIVVVGTSMGAAAAADGSFFIINVSPGLYTLRIQMMGYETLVLNEVRVSVNRTYEVVAKLKPTVIEGAEVVVTADKIQVKKDQTSSVRNVSSEEMALLPVEGLGQVINLQAGVVNGHFRGGRNTEVTYMIDGMQVDNSFWGTYGAVSVEKEAVQDLEVITGTFNAEYGRAMSGVVNVVTKDGGNVYHGSLSGALANYYTAHTDVFPGLGSSFDLNLSQDYKVQLEGPIIRDRLNFFFNYRHQNLNGYLNGIHRFNPWDYNDFPSDNPADWHIEHTGTGEYVSMDHDRYDNFSGKLTFKPGRNLKLAAMYTYNDGSNKNYNHYWKYNPLPLRTYYNTSHYVSLSLNHMIRPSLFYDLKLGFLQNINQSYLYKDPIDPRYVHPMHRGTNTTGFATGGNDDPGKSRDTFEDTNVKLDLYWQANKNHSFKTGFLYTHHKIDRYRVDVRNVYSGLSMENDRIQDPQTGKISFPFYQLEIMPITNKTMDVYTVYPNEFSAYLQDKMEFNEMVINLGVRYDYFNSNQVYPSDRRNPANQLILPDSMMSTYPKAPPQTQTSPRFGLAYRLSDQAVLHISYGHFFQMPPMYALYANNIFRVPVNDYGITMGNALLKPQKTIQYEIGIWQEIIKGMGLELALYYRDIYDLLSTAIISTYNQIEYGLYTNKDYGNARGLEVKWDYAYGKFFTGINYTLAYTRGNADNPTHTFTRAGNSMDPIARLIPMSWDQRHTFNLTVRWAEKSWSASLIGYYNSGTPYTYSPIEISPLSLINLYENNAYKPAGYSFDLALYYNIPLFKQIKGQLQLNVYNLFDRKNAIWVYGDTGQPYTTIIFESDRTNHRSDFNTFEDRVQNPSCFSAPRQVKLGFGIIF
ncbi:MAG: TonB-dependent receptor [candidate division KSB1 bacterium]|nr:TonB-dependent receptor [candidate division KSB1 bacterium]